MDAQSRGVRLPSTHWWANSNTDADRNSYGYINAYSYSDSNCYSYCYANTDTDDDSKAYTYTKAESHAKAAPESATQAVTPACVAVASGEDGWSVIAIRLRQGCGGQVSER
jgi:hypothetical protein